MHHCKQCQTPLTRKRFNGRLEDNGAFLRRKFCDVRCMATWQTGRMKVVNAKNGRRQAARHVKAKCERCWLAKSRLIVHHLDEDPTNNTPSNLMTLCGSCHALMHSHNYMEMGTRRLPCLHCEKPSYRLGLCNTHLTRLKRFGHALAKKRKVGSEWQLWLHDGSTWLPFPSRKVRLSERTDCAVTAMRSLPRSRKRSSKA